MTTATDSDSPYTTLRLTVEDRVATVTLDDPRRRNAFTLPMVDEVQSAFDHLEVRDDVGAVVITGAPPAFCAGADLSHLEGAEEAGLRRIYEGFLRIGRSPLPTVAAINGAAVGAGLNLALVCDLRLATPTAKLDSRFVQLGLHPGGGHTWMLQQAVGPQTAAAMVLFDRVLDGTTAAERGLVWKVVPDEDLLAEARALAARAADAPRPLVQRVKETLRTTAGLPYHAEAVERELVPQVWSLKEPFFQERLAAMRAKLGKE